MTPDKLAVCGDGRDWFISPDVARALAGKLRKSYRVVLAGLPRHTFHVEAESCDHAHARAVQVVRKDNPAYADTGATITVED